jgi:Carboxypeptidase regulatory-like domain
MNYLKSVAGGRVCSVKVLVFTLAFMLGSARCYGQILNASLSGTVSDQSQAVVPGATVTATHATTGSVTRTKTDVNGYYIFPSLPVGVYHVVVQKSGFRTQRLTDVELTVAQSATLNAQMQVGQVETTIEVKGEVGVVQTNTASISTVIGATQTVELPLNTRRFGVLAQLIPGTITNLNRAGQTFINFSGGGSYSANGARSSGNNIYIDGVMNRQLSGANFAIQPPPDAVQEFRIETNAYNATYGMASGSVINLVTKSGSNGLHGTVYEFLRNQVLDARDFFSVDKTDPNTGRPIPGTARGKFIRNQFGFAIGGPIQKNKTFFFGNFEPLKQVKGSQALATIPTPAQKNGDLSSSFTGVTANLCGAGGPANLNYDTAQLFDPGSISNFTCPAGSAFAGKSILVGTPIAGNIITTINPVAQKALTTLLDVTPNRPGFPNYISNRANRIDEKIFDVRIDHVFSDKDSMFGRYLFGQSDTTSYGALPTAGSTGYFRGQSMVLAWTHSYSNSLLHEVRIGFQRNYSLSSCLGCPRPPGTTAGFGIDGLVGLSPSLEKYPQFQFVSSAFSRSGSTFLTSVGDGAYSPQWNPDMVESYKYQLVWTHGKHTTQAGVDMSWWQSFHTQTAFAPGGQLFFDGRYAALAGESSQASLAPLGDFLMGYPEGAGRTLRFTFMYQRGGGFWNYFIQDDYKVRPNLTINMGLRLEIRRGATDKNGSYMSFLETGAPFSGPGNAFLLTALPDQQNAALCTDPAYAYLTSADGRCLVASNDLRQKLGFTGRRQQSIIATQNNWAPRLGISWRPTSSDKLVVHAGAGTFYDFAVLNNQHFGDNNPVFAPSQLYSSTFGAPPQLLPNGQPVRTETVFTGNVGTPRPDQQFLGAFVDPAYKTPVTYEWSLGIETQLDPSTSLNVDYVGNHAYHLGMLYIFGNQPLPGIGAIQPRRPFPDFAGTLYTTSQANSNYEALQVKVNRRMSRNVSMLVGYTWGKNRDNNEGDEMFTSGAGNFAPQDYNNLNADWGLAAADVRHRLVVSSVWRLPIGKDQHFMSGTGGVVGGFLSGWSASYIFIAQGGFPLTVISGTDYSNSSSGNPRPDRVCDGAGARTITNFIDKNCFTTAALEAAFLNGTPRFGNSGRGILEGPRYYNLDFALLKDTAITERFKLQFRAELYNSLNKPQFGDPNTSIQSPAFGIIQSTRADPRDVQFGLKLSF